MKCNMLLLLLFAVSTALYAGDGERAEKKIERRFSTSTNGKLMIDNKYGDVDVFLGSANTIQFVITLSAEAGNLKKAQETLDRLSVKFDESSGQVSARTQVDASNSWSSWFGNCNNSNIEIHYKIMVPGDIYLQLKNSYGNIYLESTNRDLVIQLGYGELALGPVQGKLTLDMQYSDGTIHAFQNGSLDVQYSDLVMGNSQDLVLHMQYTDLEMSYASKATIKSSFSDLEASVIGELNFTGEYGDISVGKTNTIKLNTAYTGVNVASISQSGTFSMQYGDLVVDDIAAGFSNLDIQSSYTGVYLHFDSNASFTLDADNQYCDVDHTDLRISEHIEQAGKTRIKATKGSGGGAVVARMSYGHLEID